MKITTTRRISQIFFFTLFFWFCIVATLGEQWWQLRGWPVNWLLQLDPLTGLGILLATHTLYAGLFWGVAAIVLTLFFGRFFCGWVCPFGALQQFVGVLGKRSVKRWERVKRNQPHPAQRIKYWILIFLLAAAAADFFYFAFEALGQAPYFRRTLLFMVVFIVLSFAAVHFIRSRREAGLLAIGILVVAVGVEFFCPNSRWLSASLQTGLLDPMALIYRSFNLVLLPLADKPVQVASATPRYYHGAPLIGMLFLIFTALSIKLPRFYCRFICPSGALFGLLSRWAVWRISKSAEPCTNCRLCEADCEGACRPTETIDLHECVLCFNCRNQCPHDVINYTALPLALGEKNKPDLLRREIILSAVAGVTVIPMSRLGGLAAGNWNPGVIRPPGAAPEAQFLSRCIKCGQCMRVCPTNVLHPAGLEAGWEGVWAPLLNFRLGTSGCQVNCVACGQICPTAAIRSLTLEERQGRGAFSDQGPIRLGTAFVDHGRCLPWAMNTPCIVCQENCPVSPKAIYTREVFEPVRNGRFTITAVDDTATTLELSGTVSGQWGSGDYYCAATQQPLRAITGAAGNQLFLLGESDRGQPPARGQTLQVVIRLQQPYVEPRRCIGCGVCEHECPVQGLRAIRVTAENESRDERHRLTAL